MTGEGRRDWREVRVWEEQDVFLRFPAAQNLVLSWHQYRFFIGNVRFS